jgi:pimeloyl-ACP methyl ester carboxylesterase
MFGWSGTTEVEGRVARRLLRYLSRCAAIGLSALPGPGVAEATEVVRDPALAGGELDALLTPPGHLHVVQGLRVHLHCLGSGQPTVVIDAGIGASSIEWSPILEGLADTTRVCAWDRPGYGWSDPGPSPRTTPQVAGELLELLKTSATEGPWVLVGHSFGGFTARYLAARHPEQVAALVLVESSTPATEVVARRGPRRSSPLARTVPVAAGGVPHTREEIATFLNTRRKAIMAQMDELKHFHASSEAVLQAGPLPDVPVLVLVRGRRAWPEGAEGDAAEQAWAEAQAALARLAPRGELRRIPDAGHSPHAEQPEVVMAAIRELVLRVRQQGPAAPDGVEVVSPASPPP